MRTRRRIVLACLVTAVVALVPVASAAAPPGADYAWAQPGCAVVTVPCAQPPASVPLAGALVSTPPGADYAWAQPWSAATSIPLAQPPAWIPTS
jgi:hypothetical protein